MKCSFKVRDYSDCAPCASKESEPEKKFKDAFPTVSIQGDAAKALLKRFDVDENLTLTIKARVVSCENRGESANDWERPGARVELEIQDVSGEGLNAKDAEDEEETASQAIEKYKKGKPGSAD